MEKGHQIILNSMTLNYLYSESNFKDMGKLIELNQNRYGLLSVVSYYGIFKGKGSFNCVCDCGNKVIVGRARLRSGHTKSCGCLSGEKHGESHKTKEYSIWSGMRKRCLNTKCYQYESYGGRGINICERWLTSYTNFLEDMGRCPSPTHSIERIDNNKGYGPENCKWATPKEQCRNRRRTRYLTFNGVTQCIKDWAISLNVSPVLIRERLEYGWSVEDALTKPAKKFKVKK